MMDAAGLGKTTMDYTALVVVAAVLVTAAGTYAIYYGAFRRRRRRKSMKLNHEELQNSNTQKEDQTHIQENKEDNEKL